MILGERSVGPPERKPVPQTGTLWSKVLFALQSLCILHRRLRRLWIRNFQTTRCQTVPRADASSKNRDYQRLRRFYAEHFEGATPEAIDGNAQRGLICTGVLVRRISTSRGVGVDTAPARSCRAEPGRLLEPARDRSGSRTAHRIKLYEDVASVPKNQDQE